MEPVLLKSLRPSARANAAGRGATWICLTFLTVLLLGCNSLFYYPSRLDYAPPERLGVAYQDHFFLTKSGVRVHGRLLSHRPDLAYRGLFVLFHGNAQNLTSHWLTLAWVLNRGYDLFLFDYPGYGQSEGEPTRRGSVESGEAALHLVSDSLARRPGALVLVGSSLGGGILMRCFPDWSGRGSADLVVAQSTFPSYRAAASSAMSKSWVTWVLQPLAYLLISDTDSPREWIPRISPTPFLATDCKQDQVVDPAFTQQIYERAGQPKWHWEYDGCGHIQTFKSRTAQDRLIALVDSLHAFREASHAH